MFTSRSEYRLTLRADNADLRLTPRLAAACPAAVSPARAAAVARVQADVDYGMTLLHRTRMTSRAWAQRGFSAADDVRTVSALEMMRRPHARIADLLDMVSELRALPTHTLERLGTEAAYLPLLQRQEAEIAAFQQDEALRLPALDYAALEGLSFEMRERMSAVRPRTLGEAKRIVGCTPASYAVLWRHAVQAAGT